MISLQSSLDFLLSIALLRTLFLDMAVVLVRVGNIAIEHY